MKSQVSKLKDLGNNWIEGEFEGCYFQAKVFDNPSDYGIENGSVSKLMVKKNNKVIFNYDRGIDVDHPIGKRLARALETAAALLRRN